MTELRIGESAPQFCLPDSKKGETRLRDFEGKWVVLYFYPKDNTKGCTLEALNFTAMEDEFNSNNAEIIGISPDSQESHRRLSKNMT